MHDIEEIRRIVAAVSAQNNADIALLFGSYARGTPTEDSDIDLIFIEQSDQPFLKRIDRYFDPLIDALKTPLEIFVYTHEEFSGMKENFFIKQALAEGKILYESGKTPPGVRAVA